MVRVMVGIIMKPRATPPANPEKCFWGRTMSEYTAIPMTMEGTPLSTSAVKRTMLASVPPCPNSARKMPAAMPMGTPMALADSQQNGGADDGVGHAAAGFTNRLGKAFA